MACTDFQADYYNNIAAVAVVLLFAKVVGRRLSRASHGDWLAVLHAAAVLAAALAATVAIWATEHCSQATIWHSLCWIGLIISATALLIDVLVDELATRRRRRGSGGPPGGNPSGQPVVEPGDPVTAPVAGR